MSLPAIHFENPTGPHASCIRQRKLAWAKYFEECRRRADMAYNVVRFIPVPAPAREGPTIIFPDMIPPHITKEFFDMALELRKEFNCPICYEMVNKDTIEITYCGHIYCKECLEALKKQPDPKCAVCRKKLHKH